jgi:hypothetical protein
MGALTVLSLGVLFVELDVWMGFWKGSIERGWPKRTEFGTYLRTLPAGPIIFCDDATLEILSGVERRRFDRHWLDDAHTWDLVAASVLTHGSAYVATWHDKIRGHDREGQILFRIRDRADDPTSELVVMRVPSEPGQAAR